MKFLFALIALIAVAFRGEGRRYQIAKRRDRGFFDRFRFPVRKSLREMTDVDVEFISLVEDPATEIPAIIKSRDGKSSRYEMGMNIVQKDATKGEIYAVAYPADTADAHKDFARKAEVAKMAHRFLRKGRQANIDIEHDGEKLTDTSVVESFTLHGEDPRFPNVKSGSWCVVIKVADQYKSLLSKVKGVSIFGTCKYAKSATEIVQKGNGEFLRALRVQAGVGDMQMAQALGLDHSKYMSVESGENDFEFTPEVVKSIAKIFKMKPEDVSAAALNGTVPKAPTPPEEDPEEMTPEEETAAKKRTIRAEKTRLKSGVVPTGGDDNISTMSKSKVSNDDVREIAKSIFGLSDDRSQVQKDNITSTSWSPGGTLNPTLATQLLSLVIQGDGLLGKVRVEKVRRPKGEIDVADAASQTARRKTAGSPPGTGTYENVINKSLTYEAQEMDITYLLEKKTVKDWAGDIVGLETKLLTEFFIPSMRNQMTDLGFTGTTDVYANSFASLGKGWIQVAIDKCPANQVLDISTLVLDPEDPEAIMELMKERLLANNPRFYNPKMPVILSAVDMAKFVKVLKGRPDGLILLDQTSGMPPFETHPTDSQIYCPTQNYLLSAYDNMVFVVQIADGQNDAISIEKNGVQKGTEYILTAAVDYEFVNPLGAVVVKP